MRSGSETLTDNAGAGLVRRASPHEVSLVARLLTRAFADDPIEGWCLACDDLLGLLELEFGQVASQLAPKGWLWVTNDLSGVDAWLPPGSAYDEAAIDAVVNPVLAKHGGQPLRLARFWEWVEEHRPPAPHWYVDILAVDPDRQGSGAGRLLLTHGLARADALGQPSFLVTGNPRTVPWYQRHGFAVLSEEEAPEGGPRVWFMLRPT